MKTLLATALIAPGAPVAAQEKAPINLSGETFPDIPPDYCTNLSNMYQGTTRDWLKNSCLESERDNKVNAERMWSEIPVESRKSCLALGNMATLSYQGLAGCMALYVSNLYLKGGFKLSSCKMVGDAK
jgi:hypothetical protein